jgi:hypothetical protein
MQNSDLTDSQAATRAGQYRLAFELRRRGVLRRNGHGQAISALDMFASQL